MEAFRLLRVNQSPFRPYRIKRTGGVLFEAAA